MNSEIIARHFLSIVNIDSGDNITPLKLQKLLYYAQGLHLAMRDGEPLFDEPILAWKHGPVVRSIYNRYKAYGYHPIDPPAKSPLDDCLPETREILDAVYTNYGQFSATKLESMTHEEAPWKNTGLLRVISTDSLQSFFSRVVEAGRRGKAVHGNPVWPTNSFRFQRRLEISGRMATHRVKIRALLAKRAAGEAV